MFQKGLDPSEVAGDFGNHSLYKNLGYFSLIGLLRLHTQLGDYYNALDSVKNVTISKKVRSVPVLHAHIQTFVAMSLCVFLSLSMQKQPSCKNLFGKKR